VSENDETGQPEQPEQPGAAREEQDAPRGDIDPLRAADVASAEAYAKDGILGAPGSEVAGARTPVTRDYSGDAENRPLSQIEGEKLAAEADGAGRENEDGGG
jgi:hypothetical protein